VRIRICDFGVNPKRITKNNPQETDGQLLADFLISRFAISRFEVEGVEGF
jgi:hypothetical protein